MLDDDYDPIAEHIIGSGDDEEPLVTTVRAAIAAVVARKGVPCGTPESVRSPFGWRDGALYGRLPALRNPVNDA